MTDPSVHHWILGNDLVDLRDADSQGILDNPQFVERVFAESERERLHRFRAEHPDPLAGARLIWTIWSAKEAAYKALLPVRPRLVWSPKRFEVRLNESALYDSHSAQADAAGALITGVVEHADGDRLDFRCDYRAEDWLHGICLATRTSGDRFDLPPAGSLSAAAPGFRLESAVERLAAGGDESAAVRDLALRLLGPHVDASPRIEGKIPRFYGEEGLLNIPLSLSHHGDFVAAAVLVGDIPGRSA